MSGWSLTGRLITQHFGVLGDKLAQAIAAFDPETATQADRDRLQDTLHQAAQKLASANTNFEKEHDDVVRLRQLISNDELIAEQLIARLAEGKITEAAVTLLCDELEANKARLPQEEQEANDAEQYRGELKQIVDSIAQQLADYDAAAKRAIQAMQSATAAQQLQETRLARQAELSSLSGLKASSTALSALARKTQAMSNHASGLKIVADMQQKPLDQASEINAIRASVANEGKSESLTERLARLSGKSVAA
jgi:hypothetical protein